MDLPAGTATLLFTDIEGSTLLIEGLGETVYVPALAVHRRVLRATFSSTGAVRSKRRRTYFCTCPPILSRRSRPQWIGQEALVELV